jgi:hypothetical protein
MKISRQEFRKIILEELETLPGPRRRRVVRGTKGGRKQPLREMKLDEITGLVKGAMNVGRKLAGDPKGLAGLAGGVVAGGLAFMGLKSLGFGPKEAEALVSASSEDAVKLYVAMKGVGTKEADIEEVFNRRSNDISALNDEYGRLLSAAGEKDDLATWLDSDGMGAEADLVRAATGQVKVDKGPKLIGLGPMFTDPDYDVLDTLTGGVGSMDNLTKGPFGEAAVNEGIRRIVREELVSEGIFSGLATRAKSMIGIRSPEEMAAASSPDAATIYQALRSPHPDTDAIHSVVAARVHDVDQLDREYSQLLNFLAEPGDLASALSMSGMKTAAQALQAKIKAAGMSLADRERMIRGLAL